MSNSLPRDYTTIYVNVGTVKVRRVTTVAHYKTVNLKHTGKANAGETRKSATTSAAPAWLPGEGERYGHLWQQPRHLLDVIHTARNRKARHERPSSVMRDPGWRETAFADRSQPSRTASCRARSRYGQFSSLAQSAWMRRRGRSSAALSAAPEGARCDPNWRGPH